MFSTAALIAGLLAGPPVVWEGSLVVEKCEWVTDNFVTCQITFSPEEMTVTKEEFNTLRERVISRYLKADALAPINYRRARRVVSFFPHRR